jgi:hypothetical protein
MKTEADALAAFWTVSLAALAMAFAAYVKQRIADRACGKEAHSTTHREKMMNPRQEQM